MSIMTVAAAFDTLAARYDELWTRSAAGLHQRRAVWRHIDPLFQPGETILDIGCGTGEDALHFTDAGLDVRAIDVSPQMVSIARARGVHATVMPAEDLDRMQGSFDGVVSNFGVLNCVAGLNTIGQSLARLIRPGGYLGICILGRFRLWETAWYLLHGRPRKAFRRWKGENYSSSLGIRVSYPAVKQLQEGLRPHFELHRWCGIGFATPPSYVRGFSPKIVNLLSSIDGRLAHLPVLRALADHRLFLFVRK
jgi:ubiquinone/menaquinone biosynthesis C-methylase UbiE